MADPRSGQPQGIDDLRGKAQPESTPAPPTAGTPAGSEPKGMPRGTLGPSAGSAQPSPAPSNNGQKPGNPKRPEPASPVLPHPINAESPEMAKPDAASPADGADPASIGGRPGVDSSAVTPPLSESAGQPTENGRSENGNRAPSDPTTGPDGGGDPSQDASGNSNTAQNEGGSDRSDDESDQALESTDSGEAVKAEEGRSGMTAVGGGESAAATAETGAETAKTAAMVMNPAAWGAIALSALLLLMGILFLIVIIGIAGTGVGSSSEGTGGGTGEGAAGGVTLSGDELRKAFLAQKNITYQQAVIQEEIRDGGVVDNVLRAVLAAAKSPGIGNMAISAAGCRSHSNSGGLHCPTTPSQALDIGSVGTDNPEKINAFICATVKKGNPYKVDELGGITSSAECIVNGGQLGQPQFDSTDHLHVGTSS